MPSKWPAALLARGDDMDDLHLNQKSIDELCSLYESMIDQGRYTVAALIMTELNSRGYFEVPRVVVDACCCFDLAGDNEDCRVHHPRPE